MKMQSDKCKNSAIFNNFKIILENDLEKSGLDNENSSAILLIREIDKGSLVSRAHPSQSGG